MAFANLSPEENAALETVSRALGVNPQWLWVLIAFESNWKPKARNPYSNARGLIQFMPETARGLGYASEDALVRDNPTRTAQLLGPVYSYLRQYQPFPSPQSLFMAVFYPAARGWSLWKPFPAKVQAVNPGIRTPLDYITKAYKRAGLSFLGGLIPLALLAGAIFFLTRKGSSL